MDLQCLVPQATARLKTQLKFILSLVNCATSSMLDTRSNPLKYVCLDIVGIIYSLLSNKDVDESRDNYSLDLHIINEHDLNRHWEKGTFAHPQVKDFIICWTKKEQDKYTMDPVYKNSFLPDLHQFQMKNSF